MDFVLVLRSECVPGDSVGNRGGGQRNDHRRPRPPGRSRPRRRPGLLRGQGRRRHRHARRARTDRRHGDHRRRRRCWRSMPTACSTRPRLTRARRGLRDPRQRQERCHHGVPVPSRADRPRRPRPRAAAACEAGGTSVHGSGLNPGNLSGVLPLALSGMSRTIDKITLQERADWSVYESTAITFDNMAFGQPVEAISPTATDFLAFNSSIFTEQVWFLADALERRHRRGHRRPWRPSRPTTITRSSTICWRRGPPPGQRWNWVGHRDGEPLVEIETLWTVGGEYPGHWPKPRHGWTLTIEGDPSMRTHFMSLASFTRDARWKNTCGRPTSPRPCRSSTRCRPSAKPRRASPLGDVAHNSQPCWVQARNTEGPEGVAAIVGSVTKEEVTAATVNKRERRGCKCVRYTTL